MLFRAALRVPRRLLAPLALCLGAGCIQPFGDLGDFTTDTVAASSEDSGVASTSPTTTVDPGPSTTQDPGAGETTTAATSGDTSGGDTTGMSSFIVATDLPGGGSCACRPGELCVLSQGIDSVDEVCVQAPAGCDPEAPCTAACALACVTPPPLPENCGGPSRPSAIDCGDGNGSVCSAWAGNCPDGEKCVALDDLTSNMVCIPLSDAPDALGEPCQGAGEFGVDSCGLGALCRGFDPLTQEHVCAPQCTGTPDAPGCPAGTGCAITEGGTAAVCLPTCDPLAQDCGAGRLCVAAVDAFVCIVDAIGFGGEQVSDACHDNNDCAAGLTCVDEDTFPGGCSTLEGCCTPLCDLGAPDCIPETICAPLFAEDAAPEWAHMGACVLPP